MVTADVHVVVQIHVRFRRYRIGQHHYFVGFKILAATVGEIAYRVGRMSLVENVVFRRVLTYDVRQKCHERCVFAATVTVVFAGNGSSQNKQVFLAVFRLEVVVCRAFLAKVVYPACAQQKFQLTCFADIFHRRQRLLNGVTVDVAVQKGVVLGVAFLLRIEGGKQTVFDVDVVMHVGIGSHGNEVRHIPDGGYFCAVFEAFNVTLVVGFSLFVLSVGIVSVATEIHCRCGTFRVHAHVKVGNVDVVAVTPPQRNVCNDVVYIKCEG